LIAGIPFSLIHVGTNVLIFILVVPLMLTPLRRYRP